MTPVVLFITHKFPPKIGGMEKQSFELITGYSKIGKQYTLAFDSTESLFSFFCLLPTRIKKIITKHPEINIIHLNDGLLASFFAVCNASFGRKIIVTFHGLDVVFPLKLYQNWILKKLRKFDAFICVSNATKIECIKRGFDTEKVFVVNNGVESLNVSTNRNYHPDIEKREIKLLSIGRPVKRKGFSWFAKEVLPLLPNNYKYFHIGFVSGFQKNLFSSLLPKDWKDIWQLFWGSATDSIELMHLANEKNANNKITLLGNVDDKLKYKLIDEADLIIIPNVKVKGDMEGFGLVALECASIGKIVLASNIEGLTDAIHHQKNGILVEYMNAQDWVNKILHFSKRDEVLASSFQTYTLSQFSWNKMVANYNVIFKEVLTTNR